MLKEQRHGQRLGFENVKEVLLDPERQMNYLNALWMLKRAVNLNLGKQ